MDKVSLSQATTIDWNLIPALHALLQEASVSRAAQRLGVTVPSMSRMLKRLREGLSDPLLVRAGRGLVPTPYALALHARVAAVASAGHAILAGPREQPLDTLVRTLVVRANDGVAGPLLPLLLEKMQARAKGLTLAFVSEGEESPAELRDGRVDLDLGVLGDSAPELRTQALLRDRFVAVVRAGHPLALAKGGLSPAQLTAYPHIGVSRRGRFTGPLDQALRRRGLGRQVVATVPSATAAVVAAAESDLVTAVPRLVARALQKNLAVAILDLPLKLPEITVAQTWHPRSDTDPAHRFLRACIAATVKELGAADPGGSRRGKRAD